MPLPIAAPFNSTSGRALPFEKAQDSPLGGYEVPGAFDPVLTKGSRVQKGALNLVSSKRFADTKNAAPGPGAYTPPSCFDAKPKRVARPLSASKPASTRHPMGSRTPAAKSSLGQSASAVSVGGGHALSPRVPHAVGGAERVAAVVPAGVGAGLGEQRLGRPGALDRGAWLSRVLRRPAPPARLPARPDAPRSEGSGPAYSPRVGFEALAQGPGSGRKSKSPPGFGTAQRFAKDETPAPGPGAYAARHSYTTSPSALGRSPSGKWRADNTGRRDTWLPQTHETAHADMAGHGPAALGGSPSKASLHVPFASTAPRFSDSGPRPACPAPPAPPALADAGRPRAQPRPTCRRARGRTRRTCAAASRPSTRPGSAAGRPARRARPLRDRAAWLRPLEGAGPGAYDVGMAAGSPSRSRKEALGGFSPRFPEAPERSPGPAVYTP
eukprot:tig00000903_g5503.t1